MSVAETTFNIPKCPQEISCLKWYCWWLKSGLSPNYLECIKPFRSDDFIHFPIGNRNLPLVNLSVHGRAGSSTHNPANLGQVIPFKGSLVPFFPHGWDRFFLLKCIFSMIWNMHFWLENSYSRKVRKHRDVYRLTSAQFPFLRNDSEKFHAFWTRRLRRASPERWDTGGGAEILEKCIPIALLCICSPRKNYNVSLWDHSISICYCSYKLKQVYRFQYSRPRPVLTRFDIFENGNHTVVVIATDVSWLNKMIPQLAMQLQYWWYLFRTAILVCHLVIWSPEIDQCPKNEPFLKILICSLQLYIITKAGLSLLELALL